MVKLTMYLVSLAPRANNCLIQIIPENNFAQVEMLCVSKAGRRARAHADGRRATMYKKKPRSLALVLGSFVPSARVMDREKITRKRRVSVAKLEIPTVEENKKFVMRCCGNGVNHIKLPMELC